MKSHLRVAFLVTVVGGLCRADDDRRRVLYQHVLQRLL